MVEGKPPPMPSASRGASCEPSTNGAQSAAKYTLSLQEIRERSQASTEQSLLALQKEKDALVEESEQLRKIWQNVSGAQ